MFHGIRKKTQSIEQPIPAQHHRCGIVGDAKPWERPPGFLDMPAVYDVAGPAADHEDIVRLHPIQAGFDGLVGSLPDVLCAAVYVLRAEDFAFILAETYRPLTALPKIDYETSACNS